MATTTSPPAVNQPPLNNLANQLTAVRLLLGVLLFVLIEWQQWTAAIVVVALAAVTDWLDGVAARKWNTVSSFGRMFDPLVDKVFLSGAFIFLLTRPDTGLAAWMVTLIVAREFLITGLRSHMEQQGISFGADLWGKIKTILQFAALLAIFAVFALADSTGEPLQWLVIVRDALIWAMVLATAGSGINYCWKAAKKL
jgi:CDP-diacylglycerol--glycerol-3-phosphate 3-phosphatidyltransferase